MSILNGLKRLEDSLVVSGSSLVIDSDYGPGLSERVYGAGRRFVEGVTDYAEKCLGSLRGLDVVYSKRRKTRKLNRIKEKVNVGTRGKKSKKIVKNQERPSSVSGNSLSGWGRKGRKSKYQLKQSRRNRDKDSSVDNKRQKRLEKAQDNLARTLYGNVWKDRLGRYGLGSDYVRNYNDLSRLEKNNVDDRLRESRPDLYNFEPQGTSDGGVRFKEKRDRSLQFQSRIGNAHLVRKAEERKVANKNAPEKYNHRALERFENQK